MVAHWALEKLPAGCSGLQTCSSFRRCFTSHPPGRLVYEKQTNKNRKKDGRKGKRKGKISCGGEDVETLESLLAVGGNAKWGSLWKTVRRSLKKSKTRMTVRPGAPVLGISQRTEHRICRAVSTPVFTATLLPGAQRERPRGRRRMNDGEHGVQGAMGYYSAFERRFCDMRHHGWLWVA